MALSMARKTSKAQAFCYHIADGEPVRSTKTYRARRPRDPAEYSRKKNCARKSQPLPVRPPRSHALRRSKTAHRSYSFPPEELVRRRQRSRAGTRRRAAAIHHLREAQSLKKESREAR